MSTGTWDPNAGAGQSLTAGILEPFLALSESQFDNLRHHLGDEVIRQNSWIMKKSQQDWADVCQPLENDQLRHLARVFTLAEDQLPGWEAGDQSPVIWICRLLKDRGQFPDKDLTRWIKQHTQNRFLPFGSVL